MRILLGRNMVIGYGTHDQRKCRNTRIREGWAVRKHDHEVTAFICTAEALLRASTSLGKLTGTGGIKACD